MGVQVILQSNRVECGLACLAMVAASHGHHETMAEYRAKFRVAQRGTTLAQLRDYAERLGFQCRAVRLDLGALRDLQLPAILHWNLTHFVVLEAVGRRSLRIVDPALGVRRPTVQEASQSFTGVALELVPSVKVTRTSRVRLMRLRDFLPAFRGLGGSLSGVFAMTLALQILTLVMPLNSQFTVDLGIREADLGIVAVLALGFALVVLNSATVEWLRSLLIVHVGNISTFRIVGGLAQRLLRLPDTWFVAHHTGDVISRFESARPIRDFILTGLFGVLVDATVAVGALGILLVYSPSIALAIVALVAGHATWTYSTATRVRTLMHESINSASRERTTLIENIERQRAIRLLDARSYRGDVWLEQYVEAVNANTRHSRFVAHVDFGGRVLVGMEAVAVLLLGAIQVIDGTLTLGMLFAVTSYANLLSSRTETLLRAVVQIRLLGLHRERVSEIALADEEQAGPPGIYHEVGGRVELRSVGFSYGEEGPRVLREFSLTVAAGEFIAISGKSGAGKSTLIKLLCGLVDAQEGSIGIDGTDLRSLDLDHYRSQLGVVMQDDDLLTGSLLENIALEQSAEAERVEEAATIACIHDEILKLPMRYMTPVGHMGSALSGGQRQRVMLARAIYRKPSILLLDEGTAHLNDELQQRIMDQLIELGITIIAATHDDRVIKRATRHIVLERLEPRE